MCGYAGGFSPRSCILVVSMMNIAMHRIQIILIAILIPVGVAYMYFAMDGKRIQDAFLPAVPVVRISDVPVRVEIADSQAERVQGLSGREALTGVDGLLFVHEEAGYHSIWMKDMYFPIDIIWISEDLEVVGIEKNISPDTFPRVFRPAAPVKYIIETNVHFSDTYSLKAGDAVTLPHGIEDL